MKEGGFQVPTGRRSSSFSSASSSQSANRPSPSRPEDQNEDASRLYGRSLQTPSRDLPGSNEDSDRETLGNSNSHGEYDVLACSPHCFIIIYLIVSLSLFFRSVTNSVTLIRSTAHYLDLSLLTQLSSLILMALPISTSTLTVTFSLHIHPRLGHLFPKADRVCESVPNGGYGRQTLARTGC